MDPVNSTTALKSKQEKVNFAHTEQLFYVKSSAAGMTSTKCWEDVEFLTQT